LRVVQNSNNIIRILKSVRVKPGISRIELSKNLGLDKSTVTVVVSRLLGLGFIEETSESLTKYQGGRKPIGLKIKKDIGLILGLEIQTDYYIAILMDLTGHVYDTLRGEMPGDSSFLHNFLEIYRLIYPEIDKLCLPLLGIGIATSGMINPHNGIISDSNPLGIHEPEKFYDEVRAFIQVPIFIDNDANCGCWAELADLESERPQDFLFVLGEFRQARTVSDDTHLLAIGLGVVIGERVHYGRDYAVGEYQSTQWNPPNKSQFSLADEEWNSPVDERQLVDRIKNELCRDIAFLVNVMNLTHITLGGGLSGYTDLLEPVIRSEVERNWSYESRGALEIKAASMGEETIAYGAASMLIEHLFLTYENTAESPWEQKVGVELFNSFAETLDRFQK